MTDIVDLTLGDDQSPLVLLRQCEHLRGLLFTQPHEGFEKLSTDLLPVLAGSSRLLHRAAERNWKDEHLNHTLREVTELEALCRRIERLLRCYQEILTSAPASTVLPTDPPVGTTVNHPSQC